MPSPPPADTGLYNLLWCEALIDGLATAGVRRAVISPGSRSTPLVLACRRHASMQCRLVLDERAAAFFALGMARHRGEPITLIATSGSAPAHWYPAVIEAAQSGLPLLLLSADRPPELQQCGANQTVDQTRLFGHLVRGFFDPGPAQAGAEALRFIRQLGRRAVQQALGTNPGPVHINLPLREPLLPAQWPPAAGGAPSPAHLPAEGAPFLPGDGPPPDPRQLQAIARRISGRPGVILCGPMAADARFAQAVTALASRLGAPLLADPLSNLRFGDHLTAPQDEGAADPPLLVRYDAWLRQPAFADRHAPTWALQFGSPPISKTLADWLERSGSELMLCAPRGDWPDPSHQALAVSRADPRLLCLGLMEAAPAPAAPEWLADFLATEQRAARIAAAEPARQPPEQRLIAELLALLPPDATLFSGNSLPIRQLDWWSGRGDKPLRLFANRGASGIDGNIATLLGLAAVAPAPVVGLIGDLATCHDLSALLCAQGIDATLILLNNGGGGIFGYLPQRVLADFESFWLAPQRVDFAAAAQAFGVDYLAAPSLEQFRPALTEALARPGVTLLEVAIDREHSQQRHTAYWQRVAQEAPATGGAELP